MDLSNRSVEPDREPLRQTTSETSHPGSGHRKPSSRRRRHGSVGRIFLYFAIIIVAVAAVAFIIALPLINKRASQDALIRIPRGATIQMVQDSVAKYLGAEYARDVRRAMSITSGGVDTARYGAFLIREGETPLFAGHRLTKGAQSGIRLTIQNERTKEDLARKIAAKLDIPAEKMLHALNDTTLLAKYNTDPEHVISFFLADTYEFYWTATPDQLLEKMAKNFRRFWTPAHIDQAEALGITPRELVILASIVDEETNQADEKGMVGRLYLNRNSQGMRLQADPTVRYALGDFTIKRVGGEMLQNPSPYNTYRYAGFPPGPIRTTSVATMEAIMNSQPHPYLYMCARPDFSGHHDFAKTLAEHQANAARYQAALNARGIK